MTTPAERHPQLQPLSRRELTVGVLVGPVLFSVLFMIVYFVAAAACQTGILLAPLFGLPLLIWLVILLSLATLALILVRARRLYRHWRALRGAAHAPERRSLAAGTVEEENVEQFLSLLAASLNLLFIVATISLIIALLVLEPCEWLSAPGWWL
ncbi:MAG: hypothetical protein R3272_09295 [Candidatus Promineifilaceae bacterium]|nr:hypothetical protein [Candidatus Promineifilaceae bacterium]